MNEWMELVSERLKRVVWTEGNDPSEYPLSRTELEAVARKLLVGADLDSVTMKGVLKDVRDSFPDIDLSAKKDFLKATVKRIISWFL